MEFCLKCGMRLTVADKATNGKATVLKCQNCGYQKEEEKKQIAIRVVEKKHENRVTVIGEKAANIQTTLTEKCPQCRNMEAYVWLIPTHGAESSYIQFFRCTKCGQTWRK